MRGKKWRPNVVPLHWEWVTAEVQATCSNIFCRKQIAPGDHVICVEEQHDEGRPFKTRYWCIGCSRCARRRPRR